MRLLALLTTMSLASAAAIPAPLSRRDKKVRAGHCCFTLQDTSGKTLQQASNGQTYFSSSHSDGWYCLDVSSSSRRVLFDETNDACIVDSRGKMTCIDPIPGAVDWTLGSGDVLRYGSSTTFSACGGTDGEGVYGGSRSGCRSTTLKATGKKGTC